jgi:SAM-dependent methyltransferase
MINFNKDPLNIIKGSNFNINNFGIEGSDNIDNKVIQSFGDEWEKFYKFSDEEIENIGAEYFGFLSKEIINKETSVLDVGCGTGRWSKYLSSRVKSIDAIDPSKAIFYADKLLANVDNVRLSITTADKIPFDNETFDFVMSVGVLHHIPNTQQAIIDCVSKVKQGGYFYVYLYYALDNKSIFYKLLFKVVNIIRLIVSRMPPKLKKIACDILAYTLYMPLVLTGRFLSKIGLKKIAKSLPLNEYQNRTLFVIRNDSLDRFGTVLEQRFSKIQIKDMLQKAGLVDIMIPDEPIHWAAVGKKINLT